MGFNAKLFEIILYPESFDISSIESICENTAVKDYAYILRNMDNKKEHVHLAIRTLDTRNSANVAKWFGVLDNAVSRVKGRWSDVLKYLTHANAPEKHQYDEEEVKSNFDWKKSVVKGVEDNRLNEIVVDIAGGKIRGFNFTDSITDLEFLKYKRQIDLAFEYRKNRIRRLKRDMNAVFITGDSGLGKTTYAKLICEEKGFSYFVSSGSNDVLDGYMGEDVIILDDLRPSCMGLSDLLKMLDNNTSSTVKSRYRNKVLECKMIIITSILPINTFFSNVFSEEKETIVQLKRRCKTYVRIFSETMDIYIYDDFLRDYDNPITAVNPVSNIFQIKKMTSVEKLKKIRQTLGELEFTDKLYNIEEMKDNMENQAIFDIFEN